MIPIPLNDIGINIEIVTAECINIRKTIGMLYPKAKNTIFAVRAPINNLKKVIIKFNKRIDFFSFKK